MGFTVEDMMTVAQTKFKLKLIAGANGWSNSISWPMMIEDSAIISHFDGKELVVTTGLGFPSEEKLLELVDKLSEKHTAGLLVNYGHYIQEIPDSVIARCNENDMPLIVAPWDVHMSEMIKDITVRIFMEEMADDQISRSLITAIEKPYGQSNYRKDLLPYFDVDGDFQVILISNGQLDAMDTVERRRLAFSTQINLENISHNAILFYYDNDFVLVLNNLTSDEADEVVKGFIYKKDRRMPNNNLRVSMGSMVKDVSNLHVSYERAKAAMSRAQSLKVDLVEFDKMGIYRMLYSVRDQKLLEEMGSDLLRPLLEYDEKHSSNYFETLYSYLKNNGSIQAVADELFTHRNTVIYRIKNIKKLLNTPIEAVDERMQYLIACMLIDI